MSTQSSFHISGGIHFDDGTSLKSSPYIVGEVKQAFLTEAQFQAQTSSDWVLADGRDATGSEYATITGNTNIPDLRGQFLRGKNNGRTDGNENPDGESDLGTFQNDEFKSHTHGIIYSEEGYAGGGGGGDHVNYSNDGVVDTTSSGGDETRPKNITINYFIKIN